MADSYSPATVSLANLAEAAATGVNLAQEDQINMISGPDIGTTMGYFPVDP
jgi:hypothetical protein